MGGEDKLILAFFTKHIQQYFDIATPTRAWDLR